MKTYTPAEQKYNREECAAITLEMILERVAWLYREELTFKRDGSTILMSSTHTNDAICIVVTEV